MTILRIVDAARRRNLRAFVYIKSLFTSTDLDGVPIVQCTTPYGGKVALRPHTTDADVYFDTFVKQYHLPPADIGDIRSILDLGSNIGLTIFHYARLYPKAQIVGIEMDDGNATVCKLNICMDAHRCSIIKGAIWKENGEIAYCGQQEWGFRISTSGTQFTKAYSMESLLDQLGYPIVDFVKMDIEGAEKEVLAGATAWSARVRCMKVEVHKPYTMTQCAADLMAAGFECEYDTLHGSSIIARNQHTSSGIVC
jgi:FkbM family methyltransferase